MQIKTTMRYHLTPVRMGIINKSKNNMLERVWRKGNPPTLLVGMENGIKLPQKTKYRPSIWSSNPTPGHIFDKTIMQNDTGKVLPVAQWVKNPTAAALVATEEQVQSPAWHSGLNELALLQLWHRLQLGLRFNLRPGNFHLLLVQPLKRKKKSIFFHSCINHNSQDLESI